MGNQTILSFGNSGEIEANNIIPITWLSLFKTADFHLEKRIEGSEEYEVAKYQTDSTTALSRVKQIRDALEKRPSIWPYLRPIEILQEILAQCSTDDIVELDLTQFWQISKEFSTRITNATTNFEQLVASIIDEEEHDLRSLNQTINDLSLNQIISVADLDSEDKVFVLFGTYWGDEALEDKYSLDFFNDNYWATK